MIMEKSLGPILEMGVTKNAANSNSNKEIWLKGSCSILEIRWNIEIEAKDSVGFLSFYLNA